MGIASRCLGYFVLVFLTCSLLSFAVAAKDSNASNSGYSFLSVAEIFGMDAPHPLSRNLPSSSEIEVVYSFSTKTGETRKYLDRWLLDTFNKNMEGIYPGTIVDCLIGVANGGPFPYRIVAVGGALHPPNQFSNYVQNFTLLFVNHTLTPGKELTFSYRFQPHSLIEPANYILSLDLFYEGEPFEEFAVDKSQLSHITYRTMFYNTTIVMKDENTTVDNRWFYLTVIIIVTLSLLLFAFYKLVYPSFKSKKQVGSTWKAPSEHNRDEWLQAHHEVLKANNMTNRLRSVSPNRKNNTKKD